MPNDESPIAQRILDKLDDLRREFQEFARADFALHKQHEARQQAVSKLLEDNGYKVNARRDH